MTFLRSAVFNLFFYVLTFFMACWGVWLRWRRPGQVLAYAKFWAGLMLEGARRICGLKLEVHGIEHLPRLGPALIASQHQSAFDTLVWMTLLPRPAYVLKRQLTRIPLFGPMLLAAGMIPIDRGGGPAALRALVQQTQKAVAEGRQVIIFPEGTRLNPGERGKLQPGIAAMAAATGLPIVPVLTDSGRLWGRRAFQKRRGTIRIVVLPPLPADLPRAELMARLAALFHGGLEAVVDKSVHLSDFRFLNGAKVTS